jgi:hypothetical protein
MAQHSLPVLSHPSFPQVFVKAMEREVRRFLEPQPPVCSGMLGESSYGAGDAEPCRQMATEVVDGQEFCVHCARVVR